MGAPVPVNSGAAASGRPPVRERGGIGANAVVQGVITAVGPTQPFAFRGPINLAIWASIVTTLTTTHANSVGVLTSATGINAGDSINSVNVPPGTTIGSLSSTNATMAFPPVTFYGNVANSEKKIYGILNTANLLGATVFGAGMPAAGSTVTAIDTPSILPGANTNGTPGIVTIADTPTVTTNPNVPEPYTFAVTNNAVVTGADAAASFTGSDISYVGNIQLERSFDGGHTWVPCNIGGSGAIASWNAGTPVSLTFGEPEKNVLYRLNCLAYTSGTINYRISQTGVAAESLAVAPPI